MARHPEGPDTGERWDRAWQLFHQALALPEEQRSAFLASACSGDQEMLREITGLLENHRPDDAAMDRPPRFGAPLGQQHTEPGDRTIGHFQLGRRLGEGGMGIVYEARQQEPVQRRVALKLIKHSAPGAELVARFGAERQALALMTHPGIARVLDFGMTDGGRPYYVMEYVEGPPITDYCEQNKLPLRRRLELFARACEAVHHAHQKGVIHRDLKPSNILVMQDDGGPHPKVIDFGVAKLLEPELAPDTAYTRTGAVLGTPEYMSPEQWTSPTDIDTRTDIYSLGVVLYELLTGDLPFPMRGRPIAEAAHLALETEAKRPSTQVGKRADRGRRGEVEARHKEISRELDWITLKALEKDRERRYGSAADLAADVRRHLDRQPVSAGPPGAVYRARKFVLRHRYGVAATAALILALLAGLASTAYMARVAAIERDAARLEAETNRATVAFLEELVGGAPEDSIWDTPPLTTELDRSVADVIREAGKTLEGRFPGQPLVEADLAITLGRTMRNLDDHQAAKRLLRHGVTLYAEHLAEDDPELLDARYELVETQRRLGECEEAEGIYRDLLETWTASLSFENRRSLKAAYGLGMCMRFLGRSPERREVFEMFAETYRRELEPGWTGEPLEMLPLTNLADWPSMDDRTLAENLDLLRGLFETREARLGPAHPATLEAKSSYATQLARTDPDAALALCSEVREAHDNPEGRLDGIGCQWVALRRAGRWDEAVSIAMDMEEMEAEVYGRTLSTGWVVFTLQLAGRHDDAEALARAQYQEASTGFLPSDPRFVSAMRTLIGTLERAGKFGEAEDVLMAYIGDERLVPADRTVAARIAVRLYEQSGESDKLAAARARLRELVASEADLQPDPSR